MHSIRPRSRGYAARYSAKQMSKPVNFVCLAPEAKQVSLIGDFNEWDRTTHPMTRRPDGAWFLQVNLHHGHHHYLFVVDGQRTLDPNAQGIARDENDQRVAMVAVS